jgi:hypothetical protein
VLKRRSVVAGISGLAAGLGAGWVPEHARTAFIAISIDLEMARHYPTWDQTEWDYEKGNLTPEVKQYAREAARRVKAKGGLIHFFAVGRTFEQSDIGWLREIVREEHPVGNHTYDHVNLRAGRLDSVQSRFQRAPWLIAGRTPLEVIAENIRMTSQAIRTRLGVEPAGFRAPGGYREGLSDHPKIQKILLEEGFRWASTKYAGQQKGIPAYSPEPRPELDVDPPREVFDSVLEAQENSQPSVYPSGLIEVPMCPISDLVAFRMARWKLDYFLRAIREVVEQAIARRQVFVFLGHPSCLCVTDPNFRTVELICDLVRRAAGHARLTDLGTIANRVEKGA